MATKKKQQQKPEKRAAVYTQLWPQHVPAKLIGVVDGQPFQRVFSWWNKQSDFSHSRITTGDVLVPVHIVNGTLCPIARMTISFKGAPSAAELGDCTLAASPSVGLMTTVSGFMVSSSPSGSVMVMMAAISPDPAGGS